MKFWRRVFGTTFHLAQQQTQELQVSDKYPTAIISN